MPIVTLTTDWKPNDIYPGMLKGCLLSRCPGITLVDNALGIPPFDSVQAAFIIRNTFRLYPSGSIHLLAIQTQEPFLVVQAEGHTFIGPDNGIFHLMLGSKPEKVVRLKEPGDITPSFRGIDLFPAALEALLRDERTEPLGVEAGEMVERIPLRPTLDKEAIAGSVVFVDSYENAITNISRDFFYQYLNQRPFEILVQSNLFKINKISSRYSDVPVGEMVALFNSLNLLEIAMNSGNAAGLLNLRPGSPVRINFTNT